MISYRGYRAGDTPQILGLYNSVFTNPRTNGQWWWEYADNPVGQQGMILAFAGHKLIGHSAAVPLVFRQGYGTVKVSRIQNSVVDPDFRRQGIFTESLVRLNEQLTLDGVDVSMAFPNDERHSLPGLIGTGLYKEAFEILPWGRPFLLEASLPAGVRVQIDDAMGFTARDLHCAEKFLESFEIRNCRDISYLNWRFKAASGKCYTMARVWRDGSQVGWVVSKPYPPTGSLDLVECFLPPEPHLIAGVLGALAEHHRADGLQRVSLWSMEHYPLHTCLVQLGFAAEPRPTHVVIAPLSTHCSPRILEESAYYLSLGDSDVY